MCQGGQTTTGAAPGAWGSSPIPRGQGEVGGMSRLMSAHRGRSHGLAALRESQVPPKKRTPYVTLNFLSECVLNIEMAFQYFTTMLLVGC